MMLGFLREPSAPIRSACRHANLHRGYQCIVRADDARGIEQSILRDCLPTSVRPPGSAEDPPAGRLRVVPHAAPAHVDRRGGGHGSAAAGARRHQRRRGRGRTADPPGAAPAAHQRRCRCRCRRYNPKPSQHHHRPQGRTAVLVACLVILFRPWRIQYPWRFGHLWFTQNEISEEPKAGPDMQHVALPTLCGAAPTSETSKIQHHPASGSD